MKSIEQIAARMITPSPLVGEGITASQYNLSRVSGTGAKAAPRIPLTRLRFAKPPSPTRGEGKNPSTQRRHPT
jgi:hypothetical protein